MKLNYVRRFSALHLNKNHVLFQLALVYVLCTECVHYDNNLYHQMAVFETRETHHNSFAAFKIISTRI